MSQTTATTLAAINAGDKDFVCLQFAQAIETFRAQFNLSIQIFTAFVIADVTVIGFAISSKISGIVLIAGLFPLFIIYVAYGANKFMVPVIYTAVSIESKYGIQNEDWLASTFLSARLSPEILKRCQEISNVGKFEERIKAIRKQRIAFLYNKRFIVVLVVLSLMHIGGAVFLSLVFKWKFLS
jgi:hypothetical protein